MVNPSRGWDNWGERVVLPMHPVRQYNFASCKHFGSRNPDYSQHGKCHMMPSLGFKAEILFKKWKLTWKNPLWSVQQGKLKERGIFADLIIQWGFWIIMQGQIWLGHYRVNFPIIRRVTGAILYGNMWSGVKRMLYITFKLDKCRYLIPQAHNSTVSTPTFFVPLLLMTLTLGFHVT